MAFRNFTVDRVTFTVNTEMAVQLDTVVGEDVYAKPDNNAAIWPQGWYSDNGQSNAPALVICNGTTDCRASITANWAVNDPVAVAEAKRWSAGFLQNVVTANRAANYEETVNGVTTQSRIIEGFQNGPPINDQNESGFPFQPENSGHFTTSGAQVDPFSIDGPEQRFPVSLRTQKKMVPADNNNNSRLPGVLKSTSGTITFATWFAIARQPGPGAPNPGAMVILLNRMLWTQDFSLDGIVVANGIVTNGTGTNGTGINAPLVPRSVFVTQQPQVLDVNNPNNRLTLANYQYSAATGTTNPDLRRQDAERNPVDGNDNEYFELIYPGLDFSKDKWAQDDVFGRKPFEKITVHNGDTFFNNSV